LSTNAIAVLLDVGYCELFCFINQMSNSSLILIQLVLRRSVYILTVHLWLNIGILRCSEANKEADPNITQAVVVIIFFLSLKDKP
jgi:hypothetical protein